MLRECRHHGLTEFGRTTKSFYCKRCNVERTNRLRREYRAEIIALAGGKCALCGYDRFSGALEFHHIDPTTKSFSLDLGKMVARERVIAEAAK